MKWLRAHPTSVGLVFEPVCRIAMTTVGTFALVPVSGGYSVYKLAPASPEEEAIVKQALSELSETRKAEEEDDTAD